eukprot:c24630_g1_i2 orf=61-1209(+)
MDPAGVCKKGVPEWLNSSLWSPSRPSISSPLSASHPPSTKARPYTDTHQLEKHSVSSFSESLPPATPEIRVSTSCSENFSDTSGAEAKVSHAPESKAPDEKLIRRETDHENEEGMPKTSNSSDEIKLACSENGVVGVISRDSLDDECEISDPLKETRRSAEETEHAQSSSLPCLIDEESSDFINSEGPLPSPLSSASSIPTMFMAPSVTQNSSFDSRVSQFNSELSKKVISIVELQRLASQGIPDSGSIRSITWKLLLGYLPKSRDFWSLELEKRRAEYAAFKEELLITPSEVTRRKEDNGLDISQRECQGPLPRHDITQDDHPLSLGKTSIWHQFFLDSEVYEQIDRDVKRTHPDMHFFCGDSAASLNNQACWMTGIFIIQ